MQIAREQLVEAFKAAEADIFRANSTSLHYLDRRLAVVDAILSQCDSALYRGFRDLLAANRAFMESRFKPAGLDALILEVSEFILSDARRYDLTVEEVAPISWAVDLTALENYGYADARSAT